MNNLQSLLDASRDSQEKSRIHAAFNIGLTDGIKFQQGRCSGGCKFWDGNSPKDNYHELRERFWGSRTVDA